MPPTPPVTPSVGPRGPESRGHAGPRWALDSALRATLGLTGTPAATLLLLLATTASASPLVDATQVVEDVVVDLRYATSDNFLGRPLYPPGARCLLRPEAAAALARAAGRLRREGFRLKVYDCYRPLAVQWEMWRRVPKRGYVANPRYGSHHNRGAAVDLTLLTPGGQEVEMPTPFDTFGPAAHHAYAGGSAASRRHRERLRAAMEAAGFKRNRMEWWHYELPDARRHPLLDVPLAP